MFFNVWQFWVRSSFVPKLTHFVISDDNIYANAGFTAEEFVKYRILSADLLANYRRQEENGFTDWRRQFKNVSKCVKGRATLRFVNTYRITSVIRPWPCIRYKATRVFVLI